MSLCEFYKVKTETIEDGDCKKEFKTSYCTHENDKFSLENLSKILGSAFELKCKGDTKNCQLSHKYFT